MTAFAPDDLAALLVAAHARLAACRDLHDLLLAVAETVRPFGPVHVDFRYIHVDATGHPEWVQPVAIWLHGRIVPDHPVLGARHTLADYAFAQHWITHPDELLIVPDSEQDPRCDARTRGHIAPHRCFVVVPLYNRRDNTWQGTFTMLWLEPHEPSEAELLLYMTLKHSVAALVASLRSTAAFEASLAEARALYRVSARINEATSPADLLTIVTDLALSAGAAQGMLLLVESGDHGEALHVAASHAETADRRPPLGAIHPLPQFAAWHDDPDAPVTLDDLTTAPELDAVSRASHETSGVHAVLLLPLRWQGRSIGFIHLGWHEPHRFSDAERRLFRGLARQAAAVLDNRLLFERTRRAIDDNRNQRQTLEALLDHIPIGVSVVAPDGTRKLINRAGLTLHDLSDQEFRDNALPDIRTFHTGTDRKIQHHERVTVQSMALGRTTTGELDIVHRDGRRLTITGTAAPSRDERGDIVGCVLIFQDITPRIVAAREREKIHAAIHAAQAAALAERSTPIIPLTREILVMPIVGAIDRDRGAQILKTLLELGGRAGVQAAILDLTGVPGLDAAGVAILVDAARGLRLRGILPILSGLRPEVAWALVAHDAPLDGIRTEGTLQSALARARMHTSRR